MQALLSPARVPCQTGRPSTVLFLKVKSRVGRPGFHEEKGEENTLYQTIDQSNQAIDGDWLFNKDVDAHFLTNTFVLDMAGHHDGFDLFLGESIKLFVHQTDALILIVDVGVA